MIRLMRSYSEYWLVQQHNDGLYYTRHGARQNAPIAAGECADWDSLPAPPGASVALAAPGAQVRVHKVNMPTRNRRRFLAALPFALEERLFHPPEAYHLAPLSVAAGRATVAVVEHERMRDWIKAAEGAGRHLVAVFPDYLLLPAPPADTWSLDLTAAPALLRFPGVDGAALPEALGATPPGSMVLALEQANPAPARLEARVATAEQHARVSRWRSALAELGLELQLTQVTVSRPVWLADQARLNAPGNLLTGSYASAASRRPPARALAASIALTAALLAVLGAQWLIENNRISAEHERLAHAIEATYREAFPEAKNLVDPRYQLEQRLAALRAVGTRREQFGLLSWLELLAPYLGADSESQLDAMDFDGEQLLLELSLADFAALETLQTGLVRVARLRAQNAELKDGRVRSRIRLERLN